MVRKVVTSGIPSLDKIVEGGFNDHFKVRNHVAASKNW